MVTANQKASHQGKRIVRLETEKAQLLAQVDNLAVENALLSDQRDEVAAELTRTQAYVNVVTDEYEALIEKVNCMAAAAVIESEYYIVPRKAFEDVMYHFGTEEGE